MIFFLLLIVIHLYRLTQVPALALSVSVTGVCAGVLSVHISVCACALVCVRVQ